ncbi:MAG: hypothetical protein LBR66_04330 [Candidatus Symbiothrix sp.]|jgi:hypothetical protein|nr:hypothetical protein [Candidatus Symbiothrix sp.]
MKSLRKLNLESMKQKFQMVNRPEKIVGGKGTVSDPYEYHEFEFLMECGVWIGGYVEGLGYVGTEAVITPGSNSYAYGWWNQATYNNNSTYSGSSYKYNSMFANSGVASYDMMYRSGFEQGYSIGQNGGVLSGVYAHVYSFISAAVAGNEIGSVQYEMIYYSKGIRDGYNQAREDYGN